MGIMACTTLKAAHVYCVLHNVSSQCYGPLLEKYIIRLLSSNKNKASDCVGDCSWGEGNCEIKASIGGRNHNKFNYVQIRLSHAIETYLLTAYHLNDDNVENEGDLYTFRVPKHDIREIVHACGSYAHGTISKLGPITMDTLCDETSTLEYAIRPTFQDACWKRLMEFQISM